MSHHQPLALAKVGGDGKKETKKLQVEKEGERKWDTKKFFSALVDAQVEQVRWEVNRVKSFIHPGIIRFNRKPEEIAEQVGKLAIDVAFGYCQSAALGYGFGFVGALMADEMTKKVTARYFGNRGPHMRGIKQAKQFGEFCAAFTFFEGALLVGRGVNDKWNAVLGSTAVGMFTMRKRSLQAQLKNGLTFGGFNYLLMGFTGDAGRKGGGDTTTTKAGGAQKKGGAGAGGGGNKKKDDVEAELARGRSLLREQPKRGR